MADQESPIPGYVILEQIAKGGMGIVYKARQKSLDRIVAIKILPRRLSSNEVFVQRFLREAQLAAQLVHPHIVRMLEVGQHGNYYYIVMEFVEGMSLRRLIEGESSLDWRRAVAIIRQTAEALGVAYRKSIVHRDIKPENILITPDGSAKLADMGLAKSLVDDASLTLEGTALGTPHYISPEQGRGEAVDTRSDIYSLGATFYYAVTGFHPFEGPTPASIILKHVTDPLIPPSVRNPSVPRGVCDIIRRMMAKKPAQRYQTPEELLTDLGRLDARGNLPASAAIPGTTQFEIRSSRSKPGKVRTTAGTSRKSTATIIAGVCGAALLLGGIMAFLFRPGTHRPSPIPQTPSNGMPSPRPESITENPVPVPHPRRDPVPSPVNPDDLKNEWAAINASATPDKLRSFINTHRADPMARPFVTKAEEMLDVILQNRIREIRNALDTAKTRSDTCYRTGDFQGTSAPLEEFIQK
ncbi:MAG: protein kinase [Planctomycetota bacterium]